MSSSSYHSHFDVVGLLRPILLWSSVIFQSQQAVSGPFVKLVVKCLCHITATFDELGCEIVHRQWQEEMTADELVCDVCFSQSGCNMFIFHITASFDERQAFGPSQRDNSYWQWWNWQSGCDMLIFFTYHSQLCWLLCSHISTKEFV